MTKNERVQLNELSLQVYGRTSKWQTLLRKGELRVETVVNNNGLPMQVKRWYPLTINDILNKMIEITETKNKAAEEAAQKAAEEAGGEKNEKQESIEAKAEVEVFEAQGSEP